MNVSCHILTWVWEPFVLHLAVISGRLEYLSPLKEAQRRCRRSRIYYNQLYEKKCSALQCLHVTVRPLLMMSDLSRLHIWFPALSLVLSPSFALCFLFVSLTNWMYGGGCIRDVAAVFTGRFTSASRVCISVTDVFSRWHSGDLPSPRHINYNMVSENRSVRLVQKLWSRRLRRCLLTSSRRKQVGLDWPASDTAASIF